MRQHQLRRIGRWTLLLVTAFNAVSALGGGVAVVATNGIGMPRSMLAAGPFTSFTVPGMILLVVVGGTQTVAIVLMIARADSALLASAVAGFGMVIWIFVETGIIAGISWLQALYFVTGILQLMLVLVLLGIASWLPPVPDSGTWISPIGGRTSPPRVVSGSARTTVPH